MPVQITINGESAKETLNELFNLSSGLENRQDSTAAPFVPQATTAPIQAPTQTYTAPTQQAQLQYGAPADTVPTSATPSYVQGTVPPQQPAPPSGVPTIAQGYTMEQLGVAAGPLVDAGQGPTLTGWLQQYGAQSLTQLPKELYGEFATFLRSLGAKI
ncbi:hypothetical protein AB4Z45_08450 [Paenibacillus sp. MCAF9]|uniref:hypothetical protein n=1 Tax=Paenibacillus sp. MCAF9 TaxID=3233046 RepID=UPI003F9607CA